MKKTLLYFFLLLFTITVNAQTPTDVFFSEYLEGSGNNKGLEIYNPTNQNIDLSNYWVLRFSNGGSAFDDGGATKLSGILEPYKTFLLINGQTTSTPTSPACSPILQEMADQLDGVYPAPTYMNGNDAIALVKTPGGVPPNADMSNVTAVDLFGQIGLGSAIAAETGWSFVQDSTITYNGPNDEPVTGKVINYIVQKYATDGSSYGPFWMSWTSDHSLIRKPNVVKGVVVNPNPFVVTSEWDTVAAVIDTAGYYSYKDIWTELGKHVCVADPTYSNIDETHTNTWLSVYPNPVSTENITISSDYSIKEIEIVSLIGQCVFKQAYTNGQFNIEIKNIDLQKGMYLVKVISYSKESAVKKILVK
jgi:hypothetical protein